VTPVLVLSPDFPPAPGGIQLLVHRIVSHAPRLCWRVVTLDAPGAADFDRQGDLDVRRSRLLPGPRPLSTVALNAAGMSEALAFRPAAVLSAHLATSPGAALIRRWLGIPTIQYFHGKEIGVRPRLARFAARNADACVAVSAYTRDLVTAAGGSPERIRLIHPGVDLPRRWGEERRLERPTVLTIARMVDRYKGHDTMVRAMSLVRSRVPGAQWVVIGDGPLRPAIAELARSAGLGPDAVRFLGRVGDAERDAWLDRAHVFAMPSRMPAAGFAGEGFGIVYLEANAHGCPAVAGATAGALDAVLDGRTGLLVDPADHVAVGSALVELLLDAPRRREMGAAGARRAAELAWPRVAAEVENLIAELTGGRPGA
jgi:phosphatidylinositol alpha-1,6-mannosyltransferase